MAIGPLKGVLPPNPNTTRTPLGGFNTSELQSKLLSAREADLFQLLMEHNRLLYLNCLMQTAIAGKFESPVLGSAIGAVDKFVPVYRNKYPNPVAVTVLGLFSGVPGKQVKLSLSQANTNAEVVDFLGNTASAPSFNKRISGTILLQPHQELFINTADTNFALVAGDIFAVRVFDVRQLVADSSWETK